MHKANTFSLIKNQLDRSPLCRLVAKNESDKFSKGFDTKSHLMAMLFAQLSGVKSLRELTLSLNHQHQRHYHLGMKTVARSTLAYANKHRSSAVFSDFLKALLHRKGRKTRSEIKDMLFLLDSTSITLRGRGFDEWTLSKRNRCTQGLKVHVEYSPEEMLVTNFDISAANVNDISIARALESKPCATYVFDKGYCDYDWWLKLDSQGSTFVTRAKKNTSLQVDQINPIENDEHGKIIEDTLVSFKNKNPRAGKKLKYLKPLRRIVVDRPGKDAPLILLTNNLQLKASKIAELYKSRWLIELLFKWLKQNLVLKRFLGRSENAVKIQLICALIGHTLIAQLHAAMMFTGSLRDFLIIMRIRLFHSISFEKPPPMQKETRVKPQLTMEFCP